MTSLLNYVVGVGTDLKDSLTSLAADMTGTRSHNIIDPCSTNSIIHKPAIPLCTSIPGGQLEEGTLLALIGTPSSSFSKRFRIDFLLKNCEHSHGNVNDKALEPASSAGTSSSGETSAGDTPDGALLSTCVTPTPAATSEIGSVAFHFNPRFSTLNETALLVMNSKLAGSWGEEVRYERHFPFSLGVPFKLMILVEKDAFRVAVDGKHYVEFKHRVDYRNIGQIHIEGNVTVDVLEFRKELRYLTRGFSSSSSSSSSSSLSAGSTGSSGSSGGPASGPVSHVTSRTLASPTLPYLEVDPRLGLSPSFTLYIAGHMPTNFKRPFVLNLVDSKVAPPNRTLPFHLSIRPHEQAMVRNCMENGVWSATEEVSLGGPFPFTLGGHFDLLVCADAVKGTVSVAVNGQLACEWKHRMDPKRIDALEITGSQLITSLRYEFA